MQFYVHPTYRDVLVLQADRELDSYVPSKFMDELQRVIDAGTRKLVIECSQLSHVSSIGIASLIRLYKRVVEGGGQVRLVGVQGPFARLLEITRLNQVFQIHPTLDDALRAFAEVKAARA